MGDKIKLNEHDLEKEKIYNDLKKELDIQQRKKESLLENKEASVKLNKLEIDRRQNYI